jgi:hypothetical protein
MCSVGKDLSCHLLWHPQPFGVDSDKLGGWTCLGPHKEERLTLAHDFRGLSQWSLGSIASEPVVRQSIMVGSAWWCPGSRELAFITKSLPQNPWMDPGSIHVANIHLWKLLQWGPSLPHMSSWVSFQVQTITWEHLTRSFVFAFESLFRKDLKNGSPFLFPRPLPWCPMIAWTCSMSMWNREGRKTGNWLIEQPGDPSPVPLLFHTLCCPRTHLKTSRSSFLPVGCATTDSWTEDGVHGTDSGLHWLWLES